MFTSCVHCPFSPGESFQAVKVGVVSATPFPYSLRYGKRQKKEGAVLGCRWQSVVHWDWMGTEAAEFVEVVVEEGVVIQFVDTLKAVPWRCWLLTGGLKWVERWPCFEKGVA